MRATVSHPATQSLLLTTSPLDSVSTVNKSTMIMNMFACGMSKHVFEAATFKTIVSLENACFIKAKLFWAFFRIVCRSI